MEQSDGPRWIKSSASYGLNACVELAPKENLIALRDSKNPDVHLHFSKLEFESFIVGAKRGEFDHLVRR